MPKCVCVRKRIYIYVCVCVCVYTTVSSHFIVIFYDVSVKLPYTINGIGSPYRQPAASITPGWPSTKHLSQHIIQQLKSVSCTDWGMSVALPKLMLKVRSVQICSYFYIFIFQG